MKKYCDLCVKIVKKAIKQNGIWICPLCKIKYPTKGDE
jgi:ribosomal protein L37AE/L43A